MVELAPPLRAFAHQLAAFSAELPDGLGPWLLPLARMVGPMRVPQSHDTGDPDGFGGLSRRGNYDRLLVSEWLFAIEEPDEFLRRAAMHEHMFMLPQFRDPGGATTSIALFDTGPMQLGAPRLAQLALLLVLARRAEAASAVFRFGMLQDPDATLYGLDIDAIRRWQAARSWLAADAHRDAWAQRLDEVGAQDRWIVGAAASQALAGQLRGHTLSIEENETRDTRTLMVRTHRRDAVGELATLVIPPVALALRLLRQPFAAERAPRVVPAADVRALGRLSADGRRLLLPRGDGGLDAIHIPGSVREGQGVTKQILPERGHVLVAADMHARRPIALSARGGELVLAGSGLCPMLGRRRADASAACSLGERIALGIEMPRELAPDDQGPRAHMHVFQASADEFRAWIINEDLEDGALFQLDVTLKDDLQLGKPTLHMLESDCRNFTRLGPSAAAWYAEDVMRIVTVPAMTDIDPSLRHVNVVFAMTTRGDITIAAPCKDVVRVQHVATTDLPCPDGSLLGLVWRYEGAVPHAHLVYLARDRMDVRLRSAKDDELLYTASGPIDDIRYEPACRKIVHRTVSGQRGVYSIERRGVVWQGMPSQVRG